MSLTGNCCSYMLSANNLWPYLKTKIICVIQAPEPFTIFSKLRERSNFERGLCKVRVRHLCHMKPLV